jgi:hypothetical protein
MKRARRYAARVVLFVLLFAAFPFAIIKIFADALFDSVVNPMIDGLEVIADDE